MTGPGAVSGAAIHEDCAVIVLEETGDAAVRAMQRFLGDDSAHMPSNREEGWAVTFGDPATGAVRARVFPTLGVAVSHVASDALAFASRRAALVERPGPVRSGRTWLTAPRQGPAPSAMRGGVPTAWSLEHIGITRGYARSTGSGVRVAVIDSGLDESHPDCAQMHIVARRNFVDRASPDSTPDRRGHGTMCAGLIGGPAAPRCAVRYSVAPHAQLIIAKALGDDGNGNHCDLIEAIAWAMHEGARVVNLSLGFEPRSGSAHSKAYEAIASRALAHGTLFVAAAGHGSKRPRSVAAVDSPAACPSVMAVGAITEAFKIASFSPRTLDPTAAIDLCAPGDAVTAPITAGSMGACWAGAYGTSVSAPLVSGIAALRLELAPSRTARSLWDEVVAHCVSQHSYDAKDFGAGIPRAP